MSMSTGDGDRPGDPSGEAVGARGDGAAGGQGDGGAGSGRGPARGRDGRVPGDLGEALRGLGRGLRVPDVDGPTMAERVLAQIVAEAVAVPVAEPPGRAERLRAWARRRWRRLTAALSGLVVVLVLTPPVRAAVVEWFDFGGVEVRYDPTASAPPERPGASGRPGCREGLTVAEASLRAGFEPALPAGLGEPTAASVSADRRVLSVCWGEVRIDAFRATIDPLFHKSTPVPAAYTEVDGETALWFPERHRLTLLLLDETSRPYARQIRAAGPTLLWQRSEGLTLRLEGVRSMERAVDIAESAD
ncbi:hypothetical protein [Streptomyces agglomeratus]|uniref:hypothetical protein n=1 Tax=Streptomyces agglomeratus TaxID=285458 RepID=UPI000AFC735D|nr:hypothetical protein [Streptomyces agglomeratus]